jgi:hypothetical protein
MSTVLLRCCLTIINIWQTWGVGSGELHYRLPALLTYSPIEVVRFAVTYDITQLHPKPGIPKYRGIIYILRNEKAAIQPKT